MMVARPPAGPTDVCPCTVLHWPLSACGVQLCARHAPCEGTAWDLERGHGFQLGIPWGSLGRQQEVSMSRPAEGAVCLEIWMSRAAGSAVCQERHQWGAGQEASTRCLRTLLCAGSVLLSLVLQSQLLWHQRLQCHHQRIRHHQVLLLLLLLVFVLPLLLVPPHQIVLVAHLLPPLPSLSLLVVVLLPLLLSLVSHPQTLHVAHVPPSLLLQAQVRLLQQPLLQVGLLRRPLLPQSLLPWRL
mmetsp:Transcript_7655/g.18654  ORF Transcript_7655/g.18654 Transcript_7655/m.18654 type:complete len:242 (+) Transcript_7655:441-1166(+)